MIPLIGILQALKRPPVYPVIEQADFLDLAIFSPVDIRRFKPQIQGLLLQGTSWVPALLPLPRAVYNRIYTRKPDLACQIEARIGSPHVFNTITQLDKWKVAQILSASPLSELVPKTELYTATALSLLLPESNPLIVKPRYGHLGARVYLLKRHDLNWQLLQADGSPLHQPQNKGQIHSFFRTHFHASRWLLQDFIQGRQLNGRLFDLRFLAQRGAHGQWAVTGALCRVALKDYFVTNYCKAILPVEQVLPAPLRIKLEKLTVQTAKQLDGSFGHLGEIGIDYILDSTLKPWIIEVNGLPAREIFHVLKSTPMLQRIYRFPLEYAYYLACKAK